MFGLGRGGRHGETSIVLVPTSKIDDTSKLGINPDGPWPGDKRDVSAERVKHEVRRRIRQGLLADLAISEDEFDESICALVATYVRQRLEA